MSGIALLYHDIIERDRADESGIVTDGSWRYKISPNRFQNHIDIIESSDYQVSTVGSSESNPLLLTFDDGGSSCAETCAPILESNNMRGHFFIITGRLGDPGYLSRKQIQDLADAGHHIGSHTITHPNLRALSQRERRRELLESKNTIEAIINAPCQSISIPGGFASPEIIRDAYDVGYDYVFVSEPRYLENVSDGGLVGRWNVWHDTTPEAIQQILAQDCRMRIRIQGRWLLLRAVKKVIGQANFKRFRKPFIQE